MLEEMWKNEAPCDECGKAKLDNRTLGTNIHNVRYGLALYAFRRFQQEA